MSVADDTVRVDDIPWTLTPLPRLEDASAEDLLALDPIELLGYVADLREDVRAVRATLQAALACIARQRDQLARAARLVDFQREQIRALRPPAVTT